MLLIPQAFVESSAMHSATLAMQRSEIDMFEGTLIDRIHVSCCAPAWLSWYVKGAQAQRSLYADFESGYGHEPRRFPIHRSPPQSLNPAE